MSKLSPADQELFVTYIKKMVPEIMVSWNIEKKEAIKLAAERWNDMSQSQKLKYDKEVKKGLTAQMAYSIAQKQKGGTQPKEKKEKSVPEKPLPPKKILIAIKPKKCMTPYMYFISQYQKDPANRVEGQPFSECMKRGAGIWNGMDEEAKQPYAEMSKVDQVRADREKEEYQKTGFFVNKEGVDSKDIEPKYEMQKQVPGGKMQPADLEQKPKRPLIAFMFFVKINSPIVKKEDASCNTASDITKVLGKRWGEMDDDAKQPYADMNTKDKERHEKQMIEFKETGKWTLEDGQSSDTLGPKKIKIKKGPRLLQKRVYAGEDEDKSAQKKQKLSE